MSTAGIPLRVPLFERAYVLVGVVDRADGDAVGAALFVTVYATERPRSTFDETAGPVGTADEAALDGNSDKVGAAAEGDGGAPSGSDPGELQLVCRFRLVAVTSEEQDTLRRGGSEVPRALRERFGRAGAATAETAALLSSPLYLHWGVAYEHANAWCLPPSDILPVKTFRADAIAVRTEFPAGRPQLSIRIPLPGSDDESNRIPLGVKAVLFRPLDSRYFKDGRTDFFVPVWDSVCAWAVQHVAEADGDQEEREESAIRSLRQAVVHGGFGGAYRPLSRDNSVDSVTPARVVQASGSSSALARLSSSVSSSLERIVPASPRRLRSLRPLRNLETGGQVTFEREFAHVGRGNKGALDVCVQYFADAHQYVVRMSTNVPDLTLHWGVGQHKPDQWTLPPRSSWPEGVSRQADAIAVQSDFQPDPEAPGVWTLEIPFSDGGAEEQRAPAAMTFVLYERASNFWSNNGNNNFFVPVAPERESPVDRIYQQHVQKQAAQPRTEGELPTGSILAVNQRDLDDAGAAVLAFQFDGSAYVLELYTDCEGLILHWGIAKHRMTEFLLPEDTVSYEAVGPTEPFGNKALRTQLIKHRDIAGVYYGRIAVAKQGAPKALVLVLYRPATDRWYRADGGGNFVLRMEEDAAKALPGSAGRHADIADKIIEVEVEYGSWTLMHRYNMANDLLQSRRDQLDADLMQLLYVWLRYSYTRHLDWQRAYNTTPRVLAHAQDQLTGSLAQIYVQRPELRLWARLCLAMLGRGGGNGQRIRDGILRIMHKHRIPETAGHFMEQWHQKLHNNTTPDDVVICEAYLAFLRSDGDADVFYDALAAGGVTRERLASYERPIRAPVEQYACDTKALIGDFEAYLHVLKSVHTGTDLAVVCEHARDALDAQLQHRLEQIVQERDDYMKDVHGAMKVVALVSETRKMLRGTLASEGDAGRARDLVLVDLALDALLRLCFEAHGLAGQLAEGDIDVAANALVLLAENVGWSMESAAFTEGAYDLGALVYARQDGPVADQLDDHLRLHAAAARITEDVAHEVVDRLQSSLRDKARYLGTGCGVPDEAVALFVEEVIRGQLAFALSQLLRALEPGMRQRAQLGDWQIISAGACGGVATHLPDLTSVQYRRFEQPTVALVERIAGEEDIPAGVVGVLTTDTVDILSHSAVRARNEHVVLATCYNRDTFDSLVQQHEGQPVALTCRGDGEVEVTRADAAAPTHQGGQATARNATATPTTRQTASQQGIEVWPQRLVLPRDAFSRRVGGSKSGSLAELAQVVPDWIRIPPSALLPFGVCEQVLASAVNAPRQRDYQALQQQLERDAEEHGCRALLAQLRHCIQQLQPPPPLEEQLQTALQGAGFAPADAWDWPAAWTAIKRVWSSKFNDRAFLALRKQPGGRSLRDIYMAVLVQPAVPADYAFVLHTRNPLNDDADQLYGELVCGLGEVLVGNYPGRGLGFVYGKRDRSVRIRNYPSKLHALRCPRGGLIFRSDSNGEDLEEFAGAGLYDSVLARPPEQTVVRYREQELLQDRQRLEALLKRIGQCGAEVERHCGGRPQDIEGCVADEDIYVVQARPQV